MCLTGGGTGFERGSLGSQRLGHLQTALVPVPQPGGAGVASVGIGYVGYVGYVAKVSRR